MKLKRSKKGTELVVKVEQKTMPPVTEETITEYMQLFGKTKGLTPREVAAFKQMAVMHNLNPFNREIYCSAYGKDDYRTLSIVTGYEVYIRKAEQSGLCESWVLEEASPDTPVEKYWATLVIKRRDKVKEQRWTTHYEECVQRKKSGEINAFWKKQPRMMTRKVCMSQGFRIFFEDVLQGIPYTQEEMPENKGGLKNVTPTDMPKEVAREAVPEPASVIMPETPAKSIVDPVVTHTEGIKDYFIEIIAIANGQRDIKIPSEETSGRVMQAITRKGDQKLLKELYDEITK